MQGGMAATHFLEGQGWALSAGLNAARHGSHSLAEEPRTGIVSRLETERCMEATHFLEGEDRRH